MYKYAIPVYMDGSIGLSVSDPSHSISGYASIHPSNQTENLQLPMSLRYHTRDNLARPLSLNGATHVSPWHCPLLSILIRGHKIHSHDMVNIHTGGIVMRWRLLSFDVVLRKQCEPVGGLPTVHILHSIR